MSHYNSGQQANYLLIVFHFLGRFNDAESLNIAENNSTSSPSSPLLMIPVPKVYVLESLKR